MTLRSVSTNAALFSLRMKLWSMTLTAKSILFFFMRAWKTLMLTCNREIQSLPWTSRPHDDDDEEEERELFDADVPLRTSPVRAPSQRGSRQPLAPSQSAAHAAAVAASCCCCCCWRSCTRVVLCCVVRCGVRASSACRVGDVTVLDRLANASCTVRCSTFEYCDAIQVCLSTNVVTTGLNPLNSSIA